MGKGEDMQFHKLYVKNFQSIKEETFVFEKNRFHHIKGRNNIGKSATLKALEALVKNVSSRVVKEFIRDDEESFFLESTDFEGNVIRLSRGKEDYYEWFIKDGNGQVDHGRVDGTSGKVPTEVSEYFNFYDDSEKTKEIINIRPPRSKLLFVDTTFGENYFLLQKALRIEEFLAAIKLGDAQKRELKKGMVVDSDRVLEEKEEIAQLKDYRPFLKDMEMYEDSVDTHYGRLMAMKEVLDLQEEIDDKERFLREATLDIDVDAFKEQAERVRLMNKYLEAHQEVEEKEALIDSYEEVLNAFEEMKERKESLVKKEKELKLVQEKEKLEGHIDRLESGIQERMEIVKDWESSEASLMRERLLDAQHIFNRVDVFKELMNESKQLNQEYEVKEVERKDFMVENKFCPVVMSMKDKTCPFSGKPLTELMEESMGR